jgi:hypothetical protein
MCGPHGFHSRLRLSFLFDDRCVVLHCAIIIMLHSRCYTVIRKKNYQNVVVEYV